MKFKKLLIICVILLIFSVGFVSASSNNTLNKTLDSYEIQPLKDSVKTVKSFDELQIKINEKQDYLTLDSDYEYVSGDIKGVLINKSITIDGNGHTLNGNGKSRIFYIASANVTLKNIIFKNGLAKGLYFNKTDIGGGAIFWNGLNGQLINSVFINNGSVQ